MMSNADQRSGNPARRSSASRTTADSSKIRRTILWASNSPHAATGYGQQTAQVTKRLKEDKHAIAIASNYGLEGAQTIWEGIKVFPRGFEIHSNDVIPAHLYAWAHENDDNNPLLITLYDVWVFKGKQWDMVDQIASWVPIDHMPAPPDVLAWCRRVNVTPIAMSRFGEEMLQQADIECFYIPHAIEKVFKPTEKITTPERNMTGREIIEIDESKFVVGMNSANKGVTPNRKSFPEALLAFAMFAQKHDDAVLYLHTEDRGAMGGINLRDLAKACGIKDEQIMFIDQYAYRSGMTQEVLAAIYTAMDVFLQPSMGEGFGIPAIEAQACGTPVIMTDATAQTELCGDGWLVDGQPWWDAMQKSWLVTPRVASIVDALQQAYDRGRTRSTKAIEFASQYDADFIFDHFWRPTLKLLS
jgi:glycosyltransferase involved in cell wall biosynthesis